jgi:trehalose 6-phosphate phosphatase
VERIGDGADGGDQPDGRERGRHRRPLLVPRYEDQERNDDDAAPDAEERAEETGEESDEDEPHDRILRGVDDVLTRLRSEPEKAAVLLDVDGTLAPIVARPELAAVPEQTRAQVERLAARYALVACVSGRTGEEASRLVGVGGVVYVGVHGLELAPEAERWRETLRPLASEPWPWVEDKGLTVAFHWREAEDEERARRSLELVADRARAAGLEARWGRKVLELRPPVEADKGTAVRALLSERRLSRALYAGDDTTDLDAFRGLDGLELAVRVAVASSEGPPALREAADLVVASPAELLDLLRVL